MGSELDPAPSGTRVISRKYLQAGPAEASADTVIEECPVALVYNGISHAVMMASPVDLEDFALGFSLSEGILSSPSQLLDIEIVPGDQGVEVQLNILAEPFAALKGQRRQMAGRSGCGLCGKESLEQALLALPRLAEGTPVELSAIQRAVGNLKDHQPMQRLTGASHAAAWCSRDGELLLVREDVGRHNALDKLIGARWQRRPSIAERGEGGFTLVTSRASYEMVAKAVLGRMGALVALSAPTSLAIEAAVTSNISLVGFAAGPSPVVYHYSPG